MNYSITSWIRLEPRARASDADSINRSLRACVHDPLWLLSRQWQLGEFQGQDAGSPVLAIIQVEGMPISRYMPRGVREGERVTGQPYVPTDPPLEVLVERERVRGEQPADLRLRTEAGLYFLRLLAQAKLASLRDAVVEAYPLVRGSVPLDAESERFFSLMSGRAPDGQKIFEALRASGPAGLPPLPVISDTVRKVMLLVAKSFMEWYETLYCEPPGSTAQPKPSDSDSAWVPERMEHQFSVAASALPGMPGEAVLVAPAYRGTLDWYTFDLLDPQRHGSLGAEARAPNSYLFERFPAPVRYRGMPALRFWEFEDARVNFGKLKQTDATDMARSFLVDFAILYGTDWFVVPLDLPVGGVYQVRSMQVNDTFGQSILVSPVDEGRSHGVLVGSPEWDRASKSLALTRDQYIESTTVVLSSGAAATFEARIYVDSIQEDFTSLINIWSPNTKDEYYFGLNRARQLCLRWFFEGRAQSWNTSDASVPLHAWAHVAVVREGTAVHFYINGVPDPGGVRVTDAMPYRAGPTSVRIGGYFAGRIRDVRMWELARSIDTSEKRLHGRERGLLGYLPLDDGEGTTARNPGADDWRMFRLEVPGQLTTRPILFLPPSAGPCFESAPVEQVRFVRDERANMTWAIERTVESPIGWPLDRNTVGGRDVTSSDPLVGATPEGTLVYHLMSEVPDAWVPLLPGPDPATDRRLRPGQVAGGKTENRARGRILQADLAMYPEEVPNEGLEVTRTYQYTRWLNGATYLWAGRGRGPGGGEVSSGLRFDFVEQQAAPGPAPPPKPVLGVLIIPATTPKSGSGIDFMEVERDFIID